jgi:uncharacterized membrane protein
MSRPLSVLTAASAVGCGVVGGVFFAFSTFVMKGLHRLPPSGGIAAMQSINVAAPTPWFMTALFGTGAGCAAVAGWAGFHLDEPGAGYQLAGGLLYLVAIVLTAAYHVPRNDQLAALDPSSEAAAARWARYVTDWTAWNHARAAASIAAAVCLVVALVRR